MVFPDRRPAGTFLHLVQHHSRLAGWRRAGACSASSSTHVFARLLGRRSDEREDAALAAAVALIRRLRRQGSLLPTHPVSAKSPTTTSRRTATHLSFHWRRRLSAFRAMFLLLEEQSCGHNRAQTVSRATKRTTRMETHQQTALCCRCSVRSTSSPERARFLIRKPAGLHVPPHPRTPARPPPSPRYHTPICTSFRPFPASSSDRGRPLLAIVANGPLSSLVEAGRY